MQLMNNLNDSKKEYLVVCDNYLKKQILTEINKQKRIINISFQTLDNFLSKVTFFYDYKAIYDLMKNKKMNYDTAQLYLSNLEFLSLIDDYQSQKKKYENLKEIYDYLESKKLIQKDPLFIKNLKNKTVFIDSSYMNKTQEKIFKKTLGDFDNIHILDLKETNKSEEEKNDAIDFECDIYENINHEINNVIEEIANLINDNKVLELNKIKVVLGDNGYLNTLLRVLKTYHIPYNINNVNAVNNLKITKVMMDAYFKGEQDTVDALINQANEDEMNIIGKVMDAINKYALLDNDEIKKEIINHDLKNIYKSETKYSNAIEILTSSDLETLIGESDIHCFILGFVEGSFPPIAKDEGYFNSKLLEKNELATPTTINQIQKRRTRDLLLSIANLHLSVSNSTNFDFLSPSSLIHYEKDEKGKDIIAIQKDIDYSKYSDLENSILYASRKNKWEKYSESNNTLGVLQKNYKEKVKEFDNQFKGIDSEKLLKDILKGDELSVSYSALDNLHKCPFKYYLNNVLRFSDFNTNLSTISGTAFHYVLENSFDEELNRLPKDSKELFDECLRTEYPTYEFNPCEQYVLERCRDEVGKVVDAVEEQYAYINYKNAFYEHQLEKRFIQTIDGKDIKIVFNGYIDKLLYQDEIINGKKVRSYAVIDYKTGTSTAYIPENVKFGLSLQLLTYIYLEDDDLKKQGMEGAVGGFFLQHILTKFPTSDDERMKGLKFDGGINLDENILQFTNNASGIVGKMTPQTKNKPIVTSEDVKEYIRIVDEKTKEAVNKIARADFEIAPIKIDRTPKADGCDYCKYKEVCFMKYKDYRHLKDENSSSNETIELEEREESK